MTIFLECTGACEFHSRAERKKNYFVHRVLLVWGIEEAVEGIYIGCDLKRSEQKVELQRMF